MKSFLLFLFGAFALTACQTPAARTIQSSTDVMFPGATMNIGKPVVVENLEREKERAPVVVVHGDDGELQCKLITMMGQEEKLSLPAGYQITYFGLRVNRVLPDQAPHPKTPGWFSKDGRSYDIRCANHDYKDIEFQTDEVVSASKKIRSLQTSDSGVTIVNQPSFPAGYEPPVIDEPVNFER